MDSSLKHETGMCFLANGFSPFSIFVPKRLICNAAGRWTSWFSLNEELVWVFFLPELIVEEDNLVFISEI